jgi:hypothetical protein
MSCRIPVRWTWAASVRFITVTYACHALIRLYSSNGCLRRAVQRCAQRNRNRKLQGAIARSSFLCVFTYDPAPLPSHTTRRHKRVFTADSRSCVTSLPASVTSLTSCDHSPGAPHATTRSLSLWLTRQASFRLAAAAAPSLTSWLSSSCEPYMSACGRSNQRAGNQLSSSAPDHKHTS